MAEMQQNGLEPDMITCNSAIDACEKAKQPDKARERLTEYGRKA